MSELGVYLKELVRTSTNELKLLVSESHSLRVTLPSCQQPLCKSSSDLEGEVVLDWTTSSNPKKNFSDWTLVVCDGTNKKHYHVHKAMLMNGDRRSEYFIKLFGQASRDNDQATKRNDTGEVYLPELAAGTVPQWLDYTYKNRLHLSTKNAVGLRYIANTFDVRGLYKEVSSFLKRDLNISTAPTYCTMASTVKDKELVSKTIRVCVHQFHELDVTRIPPPLMNQIISHRHLSYPSERLSERVAEHIRAHKSEITDELFYFMTLSEIMPRISSRDALWYLNFTAVNHPQFLKTNDSHSESVGLRTRCIAACSQNWVAVLGRSLLLQDDTSSAGSDSKTAVDDEPISNNDLGKNLEMYEGLPMDIKVEILQASLIVAMKNKEKCSVCSK